MIAGSVLLNANKLPLLNNISKVASFVSHQVYLQSACYILIVVGILMMIIVFFGCCGALKSDACRISLVSCKWNPSLSSEYLLCPLLKEKRGLLFPPSSPSFLTVHEEHLDVALHFALHHDTSVAIVVVYLDLASNVTDGLMVISFVQ